MTEILTEFQDSYFFYPKTNVANNHEEIPYQPVLWHVFTSVIDKNNKKFHIEIGQSIPRCGLVLNYGKTCCLVLNYGKTCSSCIHLFFD